MFPTKTSGTQSKESLMTENELATIAVDIAYKIHNTLGRVCLKVCMKLPLHTNSIKEVSLIPGNRELLPNTKKRCWI